MHRPIFFRIFAFIFIAAVMLVFTGSAQDQLVLSLEQKVSGIEWDRIEPDQLESKTPVKTALSSAALQGSETELTIDVPMQGTCAASDGSVELADGRTGILCATQYVIDIPFSADFFFVLLDKQGAQDMLILMSLEPIIDGTEVTPSRDPDDLISDLELDFCLFFCEGRWYVSILNLTDTAQNYTIVGTITPIVLGDGTPHSGTIRGATPGTVALGLVDYRIDVPENASSLLVDLEGTTGGDIDLMVRFGERVTVEDGVLLLDYISQSFSGSETILIDGRSDPPIQAGTYFIRIANFAETRENFLLTATSSGGQQSEPPTLSVNPSSFNFTMQEGGANPATQVLNITNVGDGDLNWTATASSTPSGWISLSSTSGTAPGFVNVSVDGAALSAGTYNGNISVSSADAANGPIDVPITLVISSTGAGSESDLSADPGTLTFTAEVDGENPASQSLQFSNNGDGEASWSADTNAPWLFLSITSGNLASGSSVELDVFVDITGLSEGTHTDNITFSAEGFDDLVVPVTLEVQESGGTGQGSQTGELAVLRFNIVEFEDPVNWSITTQDGCVIYTNNGDAPADVNGTLTDGSTRTYAVPVGNSVTICVDIAHIDTRA